MSQPAKSVANGPKEPAICVNNTQELGEMTTPTPLPELDDIVYDALGEVICPDCEHPRCLNKVKLYKQAILDWHRKQVEAVLDRLELSMRGKTIVDTAEGWQEFIRKHVNGAIEAERNKLNNPGGDVK